jgi:hypothetical protein
LKLDSEIWFFADKKRKRISAFIKDETVIQIGNQRFWLGLY